MVAQFLRPFGILVGVIMGIGQLEPRFNGNFTKQQYADIPAQARRRIPSNGAHERSPAVCLLGMTVVRRLGTVSDGLSVGDATDIPLTSSRKIIKKSMIDSV